jgi:ADP-ribose pyrophosphatase YjhB (NUDIX family)
VPKPTRRKTTLLARVIALREGEAGTELLAARHVHADGRAFWCTPGGKVDEGETFAEAARRELREEAGVEVELVGVAWIQDRPDLGWFELMYAATVPDGSLDPPASGDRNLREVAWKPLTELAAEGFKPFELLEALLDGPVPVLRGKGAALEPVRDVQAERYS